MKILQVLPALNSGGVERGTVEFAREAVKRGHESIVISSGGSMVKDLESQGTRHITLPIHKKSLSTLKWVKTVRALLEELRPDIVHVRSRVPAWIIWLAWRKMPVQTRPRLISTFHGMYSVNFYSAVMARAERVIAISQCVHDYITHNYKVDPKRITLIHRGVDVSQFHPGEPDPEWLRTVMQTWPVWQGKKIILMPGRLSRWKGQEAFLDMMCKVIRHRQDCHGVVVGDADPEKAHYREELKQKAVTLGLAEHVTFVGHRSDIVQFYRLADIVCHMSNKPEPFGRTLTEALATDTMVVAFDRGGATESLTACFPDGLVAPDDLDSFAAKVVNLLGQKATITLKPEFLLEHQVEATLGVYRQALSDKR